MSTPAQSGPEFGPGDRGLVTQVGPVEVDVPRSAGYFGGIGLAVAAGLIEPPLGLFMAAVPFLKLVTRPGVQQPIRAVGQFFDGMARPVGGDGDGYIRPAGPPPAGSERRRRQPRRQRQT